MQAQYTFNNWYRRIWLSNSIQTGDSLNKHVNIKSSISIICQEDKECFLWYAVHSVQSHGASLHVTMWSSCYSSLQREISIFLTITLNAWKHFCCYFPDILFPNQQVFLLPLSPCKKPNFSLCLYDRWEIFHSILFSLKSNFPTIVPGSPLSICC